MIVLDTSAAVLSVLARRPHPDLTTRLDNAGSLHVPHLIDVEVLSALRGLVRGRKLTVDRARDAWTDFAALRLVRYPMQGLADAVWSLRHRMTAYDANFVALAETLRCPLVTSDSKLARTARRHVEVELFIPG